jgi:ribosomal protein S27AE
VRCQKCGQLGIVSYADHVFRFKCTACGANEQKDIFPRHYDVHNQCKDCGRYYRVDIADSGSQFASLHVKCPYCGAVMSGKVHEHVERYYTWGEIKDGIEPNFGYPLYYQSSFNGKLIWAINRQHLQYLIDYLEADLREKPKDRRGMKTQADHLPTFMKLAKNRERIVKILKKMQ